METLSYRLTYVALWVLALGTFTSVSFSALGHIFLLIPGVYFAIKFLKERDFKLNILFWSMCGVLITCWLSVLFNLDILDRPVKNFFKSKYFLMTLLSFFAFRYSFKNYIDVRKRELLLKGLFVATSIATLSGLIGLWTGYNPLKMKPACHATRACGLYGMYMTYGYGMSLFLVLVSGLILYKDEVKKYISLNWLIPVWIINFTGLVLNFSRGAWLGFLVAIPFFFFKKNKKAFLIVLSSALLFSCSAFFASQKVRDIFTKRQVSNDARISFYETAYRAFQERPLFGWGYRNFEPNVKALKRKYRIYYPEAGGHAHNNYLEHLASTGIFGFIAVILFSFFWVWKKYKGTSLISRLSFPFAISFIVSGLVQYTFGDGENLFLILTLYALPDEY